MRKCIAVTFLLVVALQSLLVEGLDEKQKKDCLRLSKRTLKKMMKSFNMCIAELNIPKEEFQERIGCVVKCVMMKTETLDDSGMMTMELLKKSIESHVPAEYVQFAHENLSKCIKEVPLDPKDDKCKSYLDMGTCMQGAVADMCGDSPML